MALPDNPYRRPYLDAESWIVALAGRGSEYVDDLRSVMQAADSGRLQIVMSTLMSMEVLGGDRDTRTSESAEQALLALRRSTLIRVSTTDRVVMAARQLRIDHKLGGMDSLHLASAAEGGADAFLTADKKVLAVGSYRGVAIGVPHWYGDVTFPFTDEKDDNEDHLS